jgi:hypothetical protein
VRSKRMHERRLVWYAILLGPILAGLPVRADTMVFDASTGRLPLYGSSRLTNVSCIPSISWTPFENFACNAVLVDPPGQCITKTSGLFPEQNSECVAAPGHPFETAADGWLHTDAVGQFPSPNPQPVHLTFGDYIKPLTSVGACQDECAFTRDGTFQTFGTFTCGDGTLDTRQFHAAPVPEPRTAILLGTVPFWIVGSLGKSSQSGGRWLGSVRPSLC